MIQATVKIWFTSVRVEAQVFYHVACRQQAAADSRGSRTCVCANNFSIAGGTRRERRMNEHLAVVPSSRRGKKFQ